jgi:hypothetical protein
VPGKHFSCNSSLFVGNRSSSSLAIDSITNTIDKDKARIAYVYFDYKNREEQTGDNVIRTLLKQLLLPSNLIPRDLESLYDDCHCHHKNPEISIFTRQLLSISATFSSIYIMLDALDECSSDTLNDIFIIVRELKNSRVKVFCTSRPQILDLEDRLQTRSIPIDAKDEDVRNYLTIRVNKEWRHNKCHQEPIINRLTQEAKGK